MPRIKTCQSNKVAYKSCANALSAINGALKRFGTDMAAYNCPFCAQWHVKTVAKKEHIRAAVLRRAARRFVEAQSVAEGEAA